MYDNITSLTEKKCSRCEMFSWDSEVKSYRNICRKDDRRCDTDGGTWVDGVKQ